jgi:hypothetical protein
MFAIANFGFPPVSNQAMRNNLRSGVKVMNRKLTTLFAAAALTILPAATFAHGHDDDRHDYDRRHDDDRRWDATGGIRVGFDLGHPRIEERTTQVWVEPVYRTVIDHVWCPPTTQNVTTQVLVPDRYEQRDVFHYERGRRFIVRDNILVVPAHYEDQIQQVVTPGHYDDVQRQELVTPGHYETRIAEIEHRDGVAVHFPIRW